MRKHCVEEFPKRVGIGGLGGVGNPRQKVSIAYSCFHIYTETRISTRGAQKGRAVLRELAESRQR